MAIGIYKITSPTGKVYIGQTRNDYLRVKSYRSIQGCKKQRRLFYSLQKHGWDTHSFEMVHELPADVSDDVLSEYERLYWLCCKEAGFELLNLSIPGLAVRHSEESKQIMSKQRVGNKNRLGKKGTLNSQTRKRMSDSKKGVTFTDAHKVNIRLSNPRRKGIIARGISDNSAQEFTSMREAAKALGVCQSNITRCLTGERKSNKYIFEYV